jgi:uncharacterized protein (TIGR02145 family)
MKKRTRLYPEFFLILIVLVFFICGCKKEEKESHITDVDGNIYHSVVIGNQIWMMENLKTTKYRDGSSIVNITDSSEWRNYEFGAYCNYGNVKINGEMYGRLYNWAAANSGLLAPVGWHVATKAEWETLINYLGGTEFAGERLKAMYSYSWNDMNLDRTMRSGFSAFPAGFRSPEGNFDFIDSFAFWWTTTEESSNWAWFTSVVNYSQGIRVDNAFKKYGFSVRCIKD